MAQGPIDTILVAIRITRRIRESKVRNPDPPDCRVRRRFVLSGHIYSLLCVQDKSRRQTYGFLQKINLARLPSLRTDMKLRLPWQHDGIYRRLFSTDTSREIGWQ